MASRTTCLAFSTRRGVRVGSVSRDAERTRTPRLVENAKHVVRDAITSHRVADGQGAANFLRADHVVVVAADLGAHLHRMAATDPQHVVYHLKNLVVPGEWHCSAGAKAAEPGDPDARQAPPNRRRIEEAQPKLLVNVTLVLKLLREDRKSTRLNSSHS